MNTTDGSEPWYRTLFGEEYLRLWAPSLAHERTEREIEGLFRLLDLTPGTRVLDLCCGHGRHAIPLSQRGLRVTGYDLSEVFLTHAREAAAVAKAEVVWVHGDMRGIPFDEEFDVVLNLFTAFGYFDTEEEELEVLQGVRRALRPGGRFLLEIGHRESVVRRFSSASISREEDGLVTLEERTMDLLRGRIDTLMTALWPDGRRSEHRFSVRMYGLVDLARLLETAGLRLVAHYGGLDGSEVTLESRRLALIAERPVDSDPQ